MPVQSSAVELDLYGTAGNGVTDDTAAVKKAIAAAISAKKPLLLGAKTYRVSDTILNEVSVKNITIIGQGMDLSVFNFANNDPKKPLIKLELCYYPVFKDFSIVGTSKNGIGIQLGRYDPKATGDAKWNAVAYGQFHRIKTANLTTGILHDAGWINEFNSCNVRDSATGMKLHGNAISLHSLAAEANDIGVEIFHDSENSTLNFYGGCIEVNQRIGMKVGGVVHDLNLFGVYFESNPQGHIIAGVDEGDRIETINIVGGSLHFPHPLIFDRVDTLNISGLAEHKTNAPLTITENVKHIKLPAFQQNFGQTSTSTIEAIEIKGKNRQSSSPWYLNDFSALSIPARATASLNLDALGQVTLDAVNGSQFSENAKDYLTGNKSIVCKLVAGKTYTGASFTIKSAYLPSSTLCLKLPLLLSSTIDVFRILVQIRYTAQNNSVQSYDTFDYVPAYAGDYGFARVLGKWMSYIVPVNAEPVQNLPQFKSLYEIKVFIHGATSKPALGDEWFAIDSLEVYPTKSITEPYADTRSSIFAPLELAPTTITAEYYIQGGKKTYHAAAMPTSGTFNQGDYVKNDAPTITGNAGSQYVVKGWIRLTTGSSHTLNKDWAQDRSPSGT